MKPGDVWGATDNDWPLPEPEVEVDGIDCSHMTAEEAFKTGLNAGKRMILKELDEYFTGPGDKLSTPAIVRLLGLRNKQEFDALVEGDIDFFDTDRLPEIYRTFRRNTENERG